MSKRPAFQFYPREYLTDEHVVLMSLEEQGAYVRLLCHQWLEGTIPSEIPALARLCGVSPPKMRKMWDSIGPCFATTEECRLVNDRLERSRRESDEWRAAQAEAGRRGAEKRWAAHAAPDGEPITTPMAKNSTASASVKTDKKTSAKAGWIEPFAQAWRDRFGGTVNYGRLGKALKPLVEIHDPQLVLDAWIGYLAGKSPEFASPQDFASKFGLYAASAPNSNGKVVISALDIRTLIIAGGEMLFNGFGRESALEAIKEKQPELWARAGPTFSRIDLTSVKQDRHNDFQLMRNLESQLAAIRNAA